MQDVTKDRNKYIGGSDIPIIMGISPFKTRFELLLEKAELKENDFQGNEYTEYGNIMEPKIRDYINETETDKFIEGKHINGVKRCHTDGENKTTILEIKTTSQIYNEVNEYTIYLVQLLFYMNETGRKKGKLAVYKRPEDFNEEFNPELLTIYDINIKDYKSLINEIYDALDKFLEDLEKVKENPFITEEELLPADLSQEANQIIALEEQLEAMKEIENKVKTLKENLKAKMEEKGIDKWTTPKGHKITLVKDGEDTEIITKVLDEEKFNTEQADIIAKCNEIKGVYDEKVQLYQTEEKSIKKGRKGYVKITLAKN